MDRYRPVLFVYDIDDAILNFERGRSTKYLELLPVPFERGDPYSPTQLHV